jgi:DNA-directed RNA polymerase specialized sigma24 family protein
MEGWQVELSRGHSDAAWDLFVERYRQLIFATIRHLATDYDDVMDVFASVCEALRQDDMARLRKYTERKAHSAQFSTWLAAVVRNHTIDWFRHRDGRKRMSSIVAELPPLQQKIFQYVFLESRTHLEAYELVQTRDGLSLGFGAFLRALSATYSALSSSRRARRPSRRAVVRDRRHACRRGCADHRMARCQDRLQPGIASARSVARWLCPTRHWIHRSLISPPE